LIGKIIAIEYIGFNLIVNVDLAWVGYFFAKEKKLRCRFDLVKHQLIDIELGYKNTNTNPKSASA